LENHVTSWSRRALDAGIGKCSVIFIALALGCSSKPSALAPPAAPLTPPTRLCGQNEGPPACRSASEIEALLAGPHELVGMADTPSGMQGAKLLTLRARGRSGEVVLRAKWRPQSSEDLINEPRKELAAYAVQKLFLEESELAAPPTVAYCFSGRVYRRFDPGAGASWEGVDCIFGVLSYWLEEVQSVKAARASGVLGEGAGIWDARLFEQSPAYRESVASSNLLTYLINHGDAHDEQFVLQETPRGLRAYVVDNSIAFLSVKNPMLLLREDWSQIQVPALPPKAIARLERLADADFARLGNIAELVVRDGTLVNTTPSEPMKSDGGAMTWTGARLRVGLTQGEIELVEARVRELRSRPDLAKLTRP
jgi:hypothetical protein